MNRNSPRGRERLYHVLLIESEPDDISPFIDSFEATEATEEVHIVSDGNEALDFIYQRGDYADAPSPDLIILDLHIRGASGEEILTELNEELELGYIPVLVITSSSRAEDISRTYELNANAYLQKPTTSEEFTALAQAIEDFWLNVAHLPPK